MSDTTVEVRWDQDQTFETFGRSGESGTLDGRGAAGPSPMEALLMSLAACMGIDVADMLTRMRVAFDGLAVRAEGDRRAEPPRRFTAIRLIYQVQGVSEEAQGKLQRAVDLSRDKYCSVLHSLQSDLDISIRIDAA